MSSLTIGIIILSVCLFGIIGLKLFPKPKQKYAVKINFDEVYKMQYLNDRHSLSLFKSNSFVKPILFALILIISLTEITDLYHIQMLEVLYVV